MSFFLSTIHAQTIDETFQKFINQQKNISQINEKGDALPQGEILKTPILETELEDQKDAEKTMLQEKEETKKTTLKSQELLGEKVQKNTIPESISLILPDRKLKLNFKAQPELLISIPRYSLKTQNKKFSITSANQLLHPHPLVPLEVQFETKISPKNLHNFLAESGFYKVEDQNPVKISMNEKGAVTFRGGIPDAGYEIDEPALLTLLNRALETQTPFVRVPAQKKFPKVEVSENLKERGITQVLAVGASNYAGSSWARMKNIRAGSRKFSGMIVKKGDTFSFNRQLHSVDEKYGFVKELVIKGNETKKELGGGVCQVSTTAFRAAFEAGLPIAERRNHSYSVPYYKPRGLDASIYLGGSDFKFINDTQGDILIQTLMQGHDLYFVFYGTPDTRQVSFEGPFISHYRAAPATQIVESDELPEGETKKVSNAHAGFRAEWIRNVVKEGKVDTQSIISNYRPWPEKHIIGTGKTQAEDDLEKASEETTLSLLKFDDQTP